MTRTATRQNGLTLIGLLLMVSGLTLTCVLLFRGVPIYLDYYKISSTLERIARDDVEAGQEFTSANDIRTAFQKQAEIDGITVISNKDLKVDLESGAYRVSADYDVTLPLMHNLSLLIHFSKTVKVPRRGQ